MRKYGKFYYEKSHPGGISSYRSSFKNPRAKPGEVDKHNRGYINRKQTGGENILQLPRETCPNDCLYGTLPAIIEVSNSTVAGNYNNVSVIFSAGTYIEEAFSGDTQEITIHYRARDFDGKYYGDEAVSINPDENWHTALASGFDNPNGGFTVTFDGNQAWRIDPSSPHPVREPYNTQFSKKSLLFDIKVSSSCLNQESPITSIECKNEDLTLTHSETTFEKVNDFQFSVDWLLQSSDTAFGWQVPDNDITLLFRINDPSGRYVYDIDGLVSTDNARNWKAITPLQFNLQNGFFKWRYLFNSSLWRLDSTIPGGGPKLRINLALNPASLDFEVKAINSCSGQTYFATTYQWTPPPVGTKWAAIKTQFWDETNRSLANTNMTYAISAHTFKGGGHEELVSGKATFSSPLGRAECSGSNCRLSLGTDSIGMRSQKEKEVRCIAENAVGTLIMTNPNFRNSPTCGDFTFTSDDWYQPLAETVRPAPSNNGVIVIAVGSQTYAVYRAAHQTSFTQTPNPALHVSVTKAHQWSFSLNSTRYGQIEADLENMNLFVMAFEPNVIIGNNTNLGFRDWSNQYGELANLMIEQTKR